MQRTQALRIAAPIVGASLAVLGMAGAAAWHIGRVQAANSELIAGQLQGMVATESMYMCVRDVRRNLDLFVRDHKPAHLQHIREQQGRALALSARAAKHSQYEPTRLVLLDVHRHLEKFFERFAEMTDHDTSGEALAAARGFADEALTRDVLDPVERGMAMHSRFIAEVDARDWESARQLRWGFVVVGVLGASVGLWAGYGLTRAISRTILQVDVTVRGLADKLNEAGAPVRIAASPNPRSLEQALVDVEHKVGEVVERLQQRELEVLRGEQLAQVGKLAAALAHELRNPLMPVKMLVQSAMERGPEPALKGKALGVVHEEIGRIESAIQAFLDFARPAPPEVRPLDLRDVAHSAIDLVAIRAGRQDVAILRKFPPQQALALADPTQARQVIVNLLLNALDASPEGGAVLVTVSGGVAPPEDLGRADDDVLMRGLVALREHAEAPPPRGPGPRAGHRAGPPRRDPRPPLRAVRHHQGDGHGARPLDLPPDRRRPRRDDPRPQ
jgi:two-component system sensor histidine kinase HydH